jgi:uncharacterized protein
VSANELDTNQGGGLSGDDVIALLGLVPLEGEGGWWARTHYDECSSAIYYLLRAGECSKLHSLVHPEVYHWYGGAPLQLLLLWPDGTATEPVLGPDILRGQRPQLVVPPGVWQGSTSLGAWTLAGTTMAPRYEDHEFTLADRATLIDRYPSASSRISQLT